MDVVAFSKVKGTDIVTEVGVGTGNFLALFAGHAARLIGIDVTEAMLRRARESFTNMELVQGDGAALPLRSDSVDLVTSAQTLHHIREPIPVLAEMRRIMAGDGRMLLVDQVAPENVEQAMMMNALDVLRDPSHAQCRPPSAFRIMVVAVGLEVVDQEIHESRERFSVWMSPDEFPNDRVSAVHRFIADHGDETGMGWERDGDDWVYTRRRIMLLARRGG